jgi:hypothetical protein
MKPPLRIGPIIISKKIHDIYFYNFGLVSSHTHQPTQNKIKLVDVYYTPLMRDIILQAKLVFYIKPVGADGNCLYRAISDQFYGTENYYKHVKDLTISWILDNENTKYLSPQAKKIWFVHEDFWMFKDKGVGKGKGSWKEVVNKFYGGNEWGDQFIIWIICHIYKVKIVINLYAGIPLKFATDQFFGIDTNGTVYLYNYSGTHFDSLVPIGYNPLLSVPK